MTAHVRDIVAALEAAYPPGLAQDWDAVGLVCGDPDWPVSAVLVAVDAVPVTVAEAIDGGAQLLVAHHPLLLRGVHGVPANEPKGALVHQLIRSGTALFCAHTNADAADPGVSDALAAALGLTVTGPLVPEPPRPGTEFGTGFGTGLGRVGTLPDPEPFGEFVGRVERALPRTACGIRAAGDPARIIHRVAVCGGAGDSALDDAAAAGVDAYLTADLRHHPAAEHLLRGGPALVDAAHWATEHPWCGQAAAVVRAALGSSVDVRVSMLRTDPWTIGSG